MCGETIGSPPGPFGSHKLARKEKGARRVISDKMVDKSAFYTWSMTRLDEFWEAQRFYITAEINRMRKKSQATRKTIMKDKTVVEETE